MSTTVICPSPTERNILNHFPDQQPFRGHLVLIKSNVFKTEEVYKILDIPADKGWTLNATITAGYPLGKWGVATRKPVEEVTFLNKWGESPDWNLNEPLWNY